MRELSLHILDLLENSIRAGASVIAVTITQDHTNDRMSILIEDNGPGLQVPYEVVLDPFYSTKTGKKTGLGLSLFRFRAEQSGGTLTLDKSALGGLAVSVTMQLSHIDRSPLGDLGATFLSLVFTNPEIDFRCRLCVDSRTWEVSSTVIAQTFPPDQRDEFVIAGQMRRQIQEGLQTLGFVE